MNHPVYDIAIIGAGILGLAVAIAASAQGLNVVVIERTASPNGASVRNFGQALVTGQAPGVMHRLASESREIWQQLAVQAGFTIKSQGCLIFAGNHQQQQLLEAFFHGRARQEGYAVEMLGHRQITRLYNGQFSHYSMALHGLADQQLYSREALPAVVNFLQRQGVTFLFSTLARDIDADTPQVITTQGVIQAQKIVVCSGHDFQTLLAEEFSQLQPQICTLQMLKVRPVTPLQLQHAMLTGLSGVHYGAFADLPQAQAVRDQIHTEAPQIERYGIHLLMSPTPYGEIIIGDSHQYGEQAVPFHQEDIDNTLLTLAQQTLNMPVSVIQRWQGVYSSSGNEPFSFVQRGRHVSGLIMRTGLGMSIGPALGRWCLQKIAG